MKITEALKAWIVENCDVKADANDDDFRKAAGVALATGELTADEFTELMKEPESKEANEFAKKMDAIASGLSKLTETLVKEKETKEPVTKEKETKKPETKEKETKEKLSETTKMVAGMVDGEKKEQDIRVKEAIEQYSDTKTAAIYPQESKGGGRHPFAGRPIRDYSEYGKELDKPSDRDMAVCGAYGKLLCSVAESRGSKMIGYQRLSDHDKELIQYAMENMKWGGSSDGGERADIIDRKLTPSERKDLIDDSTSGGLEAAPIVFDDVVIQAPLLHGELYPLVNTIPLDRGRRIEGVSTGTVTGGWGGVDATAIGLFSTSTYVSAFDTTIFRWQGAVRIGLDFLSDTPIDFGQHFTTQYGERLLEDLDDVIATGNGTTQPEGVINHTGITTVAWGAATSIGNYESLRFSIAKPEHRPNVMNSAVFCGTETSYQRMKAIPVGSADDRRLFGAGIMGTDSYDGYSMMGRAYKINESLSNAQIFYAILGRYRMYRRRGLTVRTSTEGDTLVRRNELLITVTARYGGQLERGACCAVTTTAPA